ncbi:MAG: hypothetical protein HC808_04520 [Candidatus Competibacteraceae bacterium]|nr:hypothetical protein [Candidatus Competibacteraceae bacterium]
MTTHSAISVRQADYRGWDAWWVERGPLTLILVPQVGGRIMDFHWHGHSLAFVNDDLAGRVEDVAAVSDVRTRKQELDFLLWGGDKTWLAPQTHWTDALPFLDLDSGAYSIDFDHSEPHNLMVRMTSPICRETGIQLTRTIRLSEAASVWALTHHMKNCSDQITNWALWDVDMIRRPAQIYLPRSSDSVYPEGVKTFDNEGESTMIRDSVVSYHGAMVKVDCTTAHKFKFGVDAEYGSIFAVLDVEGLGSVGYRKQFPTFHPQPYGHGCVAEVFNASLYHYLELESHGPVVTLQPGESAELTIRRELFNLSDRPMSEKDIQAYLQPADSASV